MAWLWDWPDLWKPEIGDVNWKAAYEILLSNSQPDSNHPIRGLCNRRRIWEELCPQFATTYRKHQVLHQQLSEKGSHMSEGALTADSRTLPFGPNRVIDSPRINYKLFCPDPSWCNELPSPYIQFGQRVVKRSQQMEMGNDLPVERLILGISEGQLADITSFSVKISNNNLLGFGVTYWNRPSRHIGLCLEGLQTIQIDGRGGERITKLEIFGDDLPCALRITTNKKCWYFGNQTGNQPKELEVMDDDGLKLELLQIERILLAKAFLDGPSQGWALPLIELRSESLRRRDLLGKLTHPLLENLFLGAGHIAAWGGALP
ncbi:unnamed protein product [Clonostachys rosea]|uniref:Uncharacterized protein n=1 Tax=Bionectria ochroleuca TaxID=29856 RepID=A0ABY6UPM2_BIOOC|nr:unnamed protein product [Clonostachys rosea]